MTKALEHFIFGIMAIAFAHVETSGFIAPDDDSPALELLQAHQGDFERIINAQTAGGNFRRGKIRDLHVIFPTEVNDPFGGKPNHQTFEPENFAPTQLSSVLSSLEKDVLQMIAEGYSLECAAEKLGLTEAYFASLVDSPQKKLGARNILHAVTLAVLNGHISIGPEIPE